MSYAATNTSQPNTKPTTVTHLSQNEFKKKISEEPKQTVIIDVRTPKEFKRGHIPGAINIPHIDIIKDRSTLKEYLGKDIIFYCHSGVRVKKVTDYLTTFGHEGLHHLKGDFRAWSGNLQEVKK